MADTPVDADNESPEGTSVGTPAPETPASQAAETPGAAGDPAAEETPADQGSAPAKRTAAKKAAAPRKKAATAKKAPAKKTAAKKTTKKAAASAEEPTEAVAADPAAGTSAAPAAERPDVAPLFQAPEKPAAKRTRSKAKPKPAPEEDPAEGTAAEQSASVVEPATPAEVAASEETAEEIAAPAVEETSEDADQAEETSEDADQAEDTEGSTSAQRRRRRRGGRRRRKPGSGATPEDGDEAEGEQPETAGRNGGPKGERDDQVAQDDQVARVDRVDDAAEADETGKGGTGGTAATGGKAGKAGKAGTAAKGGTGGKGGRGGRAQNAAKADAAPDADKSDKSDKSDASVEADAADKVGEDQGESGEGSSGTSRRRRRRRREGDTGEAADDDTKTVTRVRKARSAEDEITAVSGSTRLEAKKQRRREGREAGRRRAPIISEAEFLARRESVDRVMVVRQRNDLTQIAVLEDKVLVEHYVARESQTSLIGNVYLGRVQNVLPSMEAAFIDIGKGRNAVLYAGEVNWSALGHKEGAPRKIESVLQSGQTVLVQVTKDPVGHKGARLTSQISLAGRFLVYVPDGTTSGISRKLPDTERARLKNLLKDIVPDSAGVIVRTAAEGASEEELTRDVERLKARWEDIEAKVAKGNVPQLLYGEPDLTLKVVRDLFTEDFSRLVVQGDDAWETVHDYVEHVAPDLADRLERYQPDDGPDVFAAYRIDEQIAKGLDRKVWLPSGGSLVIDRTEAMTVVDVNTGKFTGSGGNLEETVTKNNLEAAEEIVRQLRLRDIGGIIVVDFIDMVLESNRDLVLRRLVECLGRDRTRHQVAEVTSLGLVQMTRKRIGTGLLEAFSETCDHCQGRGLTVHDLPVEPRRGGDDESRRGTGRRRGRGKGGPAEQEAPKPVPSPKVVAAMAKAHPPVTEEDGEAVDVPVAVVEHSDEPLQPVTSVATSAEPATDPAPVETSDADETTADGTPADEKPADEKPADEKPADREQDEPAVEVPIDEPAKPVTKVVTRTRRRAASRPAGPPAGAEAAELPSPGGSEAAAAGPGTPPSAVEEPHVEHVPIKKKGARKR